MADEQDNVDPKLERLLRQWGAQQARDEAGKLRLDPPDLDAPTESQLAPARPVAAPRGRAAVALVLRWAPLAAAAVMLVAAGWLYLAAGDRGHTSQATEKAVAYETVEDLQPRAGTGVSHDELQAQLADAQRRLREYEQHAATQQAGTLAQLQLLEQARQQASKAQADLAAVQAQKEALELAAQKLDREAADLRVTLAKVGSASKALQASYDSLAAESAKTKTRLEAAAGELLAARKQVVDAQQAVTKAQADVSDAKIASAQRDQQLRAVYMAALAGQRQGLPAAREAIVNGRYLQRLGAARRHASPELTATLDQLEVAAIRLSTLNCEDPQAVAGFRKMLAESKLDAAVAKALETKPAAQLGQLLLEAQIILAEAKREA